MTAHLARWLMTGLALMAGAAQAAAPRNDALPSESPAPPIIQLRPGPAAESIADPEPAAGNPLWSIPLRALTGTRERPIFLPSRRPPAPVVANVPVAEPPVAPIAPPAEPEPLTLRLVGTIANPSFAMALFSDGTLPPDATRPPIRLRRGEAHRGWVVREIRRQDVVLEKSGRLETVVFARRDATPTISPTAESSVGADLARLDVMIDPPR